MKCLLAEASGARASGGSNYGCSAFAQFKEGKGWRGTHGGRARPRPDLARASVCRIRNFRYARTSVT